MAKGLRGRIWDFVPSWHDYVDLVQIAFRMEMSRNICIEDKEYEQDRNFPEGNVGSFLNQGGIRQRWKADYTSLSGEGCGRRSSRSATR